MTPKYNMTSTVCAVQKYITGTAEALKRNVLNINLSAEIYGAVKSAKSVKTNLTLQSI